MLVLYQLLLKCTKYQFTSGTRHLKVVGYKINDIHDLLYTAIFETRQYLVSAFAFGLACAVLGTGYWKFRA